VIDFALFGPAEPANDTLTDKKDSSLSRVNPLGRRPTSLSADSLSRWYVWKTP
jgi:hypothetical protein